MYSRQYDCRYDSIQPFRSIALFSMAESTIHSPGQFCEASAIYHRGSSAWGWRPSTTVSNWWFNKWHYIWTSRVPHQTQYLLEWGLRVCSKNCVLIKNPCHLQKPPSGCLLQKGERNEALLPQPYHLYKKAWCDQMSKKPKPKHMT